MCLIGFTKNQKKVSHEDLEIVKIFSPLTDNLNAPNENGHTPINWAAQNGHTEIIIILAPLIDNPNAPENLGTIQYIYSYGKLFKEVMT